MLAALCLIILTCCPPAFPYSRPSTIRPVPHTLVYLCGPAFWLRDHPSGHDHGQKCGGRPNGQLTGTLWKLDALGVAQFYAAVAGTLDGVPGVPVVNSTGSGTGTLALNAADTVSFARTTLVAPFNADISLSISIGDTAENAVAGNGIIDTLTSAVFSSIILIRAIRSGLAGWFCPMRTVRKY